ncbi:MAG: archease [Anaerolineae bacterium]|jgi:SHS2 domain-containing protein
MQKHFEEIEHTADIAIRVWGHDLAALFANAAYAMSCLLTDVEDVVPTVEQTIELVAEDVEVLLVDWLSELLFLGERDNLVFTTVDRLRVTPNRLHATVRGGPIQERYSHIKAVTFSELQITGTEEGYETVIVFDV